MQFIANPTQIVSYCRKLLPVAQVPRELTGNFNCEHYNSHFAHYVRSVAATRRAYCGDKNFIK